MRHRFPNLRKAFRDHLVAVLMMALVAGAVGAMDLAIYPSYHDSLKDFKMPSAFEGLVGEGLSIASPEGFINGEWYSWVPLLFITVAVIAGTGATAGEEANGTMDILLAQPVTRRRLVLEKAAGIALAAIMGVLLSLLGFYLVKPFVDFPVGPVRLFEATLSVIPLVLLFAMLAVWAGVTFPNRSLASMFTIGVLVVAYFLQLMGPTASFLEWPQKASPFYWADSSKVIVHGIQWWRSLLLLAVAAFFLAWAVFNFERRDIAAGSREWSFAWLTPWRHNQEPAEPEPTPSSRSSSAGPSERRQPEH